MTLMTLGKTGIVCDRNGFGALPIQRVETTKAIEILRRALDGGITYFDTARLYSDSEEKLGLAFAGMRDKIFLATKTPATTPDAFWRDLETSLTKLKTDYIDVYQFHCAAKSFAPDDGTGMYECMLEAKKQGKIRHIGLTAHLLGVARDCVESGLYETLQYPQSYLSSDDEIAMVHRCTVLGMGLVAMKVLAGG
ncbi:MAG: aldo/keto reductase, partial [Planctomycetia bacterium]|nr:aldo/keto reductase [Planctomycetia bacterium]